MTEQYHDSSLSKQQVGRYLLDNYLAAVDDDIRLLAERGRRLEARVEAWATNPGDQLARARAQFSPVLLEAVESLVTPIINRISVRTTVAIHPVEVAAQKATDAVRAGRMVEAEDFLVRYLLIRKPELEHHEALLRVMSRAQQVRLSERRSPAGWLRTAVLRTYTGIFAEREGLDSYSRQLAKVEKREEEAAHQPGGLFILPRSLREVDNERTFSEYLRPKRSGMPVPSLEDPWVLVPRRYDGRADTLVDLARNSRHPETRERARKTLKYKRHLEESQDILDPDEDGKVVSAEYRRGDLEDALGGENAVRALQRSARQRYLGNYKSFFREVSGMGSKVRAYRVEGKFLEEATRGITGGTSTLPASRTGGQPADRARLYRQPGRLEGPTRLSTGRSRAGVSNLATHRARTCGRLPQRGQAPTRVVRSYVARGRLLAKSSISARAGPPR